MAKYMVCCVFDAAVGLHMRPFFVQTCGQAVRAFTDEVNRPGEENVLYQHPADMSLIRIGEWDELTAVFERCEPEILVRGAHVRRDLSIPEPSGLHDGRN